MGKAIGDGDKSVIKNFYRYKVCDSIIELDINRRLRESTSEDSTGARTNAVQKEKIDDLKRLSDDE